MSEVTSLTTDYIVLASKNHIYHSVGLYGAWVPNTFNTHIIPRQLSPD